MMLGHLIVYVANNLAVSLIISCVGALEIHFIHLNPQIILCSVHSIQSENFPFLILRCKSFKVFICVVLCL